MPEMIEGGWYRTRSGKVAGALRPHPDQWYPWCANVWNPDGSGKVEETEFLYSPNGYYYNDREPNEDDLVELLEGEWACGVPVVPAVAVRQRKRRAIGTDSWEDILLYEGANEMIPLCRVSHAYKDRKDNHLIVVLDTSKSNDERWDGIVRLPWAEAPSFKRQWIAYLNLTNKTHEPNKRNA